MASRAVLVNFPEKVLSGLDSLVEEGVFDNRSEAIREATRKIIMEYRGIAGPAEKPSVELVREVRAKMWRDALRQAKGDEQKAMDLIARKAKKAADKFWPNIRRAR
ncbi:MAG: hypothetical protein KAW41_04585 [Candidatus Diapherotrites archaeon]|nr:hypothetical protein [Candidatus Diapherotrites archaeon]